MPEGSIAPGPRNLAAPIAIRPVLEQLRSCPADTSGTIPAAGGTGCFRLDPTGLTLSRVQNLQTGPRTGPNGLPDDGRSLLITMAPQDASAFAALTTESVGGQIAIVVDGRVWAAPRVATPIKGGSLEILLDQSPAADLIAALTG